MGCQPIADYGIIGDLHSVALVGKNGCISWCCLPRFDSPSVFGALLDERKGSCFSLSATGGGVKQIYLPNTNVLVTRFLSDRGMAEVIDLMPIGRESGGETEQESRQLVRIAKAIRGPANFRRMPSRPPRLDQHPPLPPCRRARPIKEPPSPCSLVHRTVSSLSRRPAGPAPHLFDAAKPKKPFSVTANEELFDRVNRLPIQQLKPGGPIPGSWLPMPCVPQ